MALGPGVGSLRWACTFHASGDANSTQRNPVIWWNMGFKPEIQKCHFTSNFELSYLTYQLAYTHKEYINKRHMEGIMSKKSI